MHIQDQTSAEEVIKFRQKGGVIFAECLTSAIACDGNMLWDQDWNTAAGYVMSPPISTVKGNQEYIMRMLQTGDIMTTASDNCVFN